MKKEFQHDCIKRVALCVHRYTSGVTDIMLNFPT